MGKIRRAKDKKQKTYFVTVSWKCANRVAIKATSEDDAREKAQNMDLPTDGEYVDGSLQVDQVEHAAKLTHCLNG